MLPIPERGRAWSELKVELEAAKKNDYSWRKGRIPLYMYYVDDDLLRVQIEAYNAYFVENNLGHKAFPSLKRLEGEVVAMGLNLMRAPKGAAASFTSGGSESIFLAVKTARDWARAEKGIVRPKMVLPRTCHPTFDRAAHYLGIEVVRVKSTRNDFRADVGAMAERIDADTIMLAGSAPNYPYGVFDPIADLAKLAEKHKLWLHVDACVGGFLAPFAKQIGHDIPDWDFSIPGVTSISADLHKYGFTAKGASLMMLREAALQKYQVFDFNNWERGPYLGMTSQGTRAGGAVAAAWAVLNYLGMEGYRKIARTIMGVAERLSSGVNEIDGLAALEPRELCMVAYRSVDSRVDIDAVAEGLDRRGWFVGRLAEPRGIHFAINPVHDPIVDEYLADLRAVVAEVRDQGLVGKAAGRTY